jgi:hypothetical protein
MAEVRQLYGEIRRECRGCPNPTMAYALLRAAREFCQSTQFIRRVVTFQTQLGIDQYVLTPETCTGLNPSEEVIGLRHWQIQGPSGIQPGAFPYGTQVNPNLSAAQPWAISYIPEGVVQFSPPPDKAYTVMPEVVVQPVYGSVWIPDELMRKFDRAIGYGALAWIHGQGGNEAGDQNPYYNEGKAAKNAKLFNDEIMRGRRLAQNDSTPAPRAWMRRGYARGGRRYT